MVQNWNCSMFFFLIPYSFVCHCFPKVLPTLSLHTKFVVVFSLKFVLSHFFRAFSRPRLITWWAWVIEKKWINCWTRQRLWWRFVWRHVWFEWVSCSCHTTSGFTDEWKFLSPLWYNSRYCCLATHIATFKDKNALPNEGLDLLVWVNQGCFVYLFTQNTYMGELVLAPCLPFRIMYCLSSISVIPSF